LQNATKMADAAVAHYSMFGEEAGFQTTSKNKISEERKSLIDEKV